MTAPEAGQGPPDQEAVMLALRKAVEGVFSDFGEFSTRWLLVGETLTADNERALWLASSEGAKPWDTLGLAYFVIERERAGIHRQFGQEPD